MVTVIKANGEKELFSEEKLLHSIHRAGIPRSLQYKVLAHIKERLYENIPTSEIYEHIVEFLSQSEHPFTRTRYSLKAALMLLGPSGYPFEEYVARILTEHGYTTQIRQILHGSCIDHEIDVIATNGSKKSLVEAKYHNSPGARTDVHVPMYIKTRFEDLKRQHNFTDAWVVTNTKTTLDAIRFAQCCGIRIISWSYPAEGSLRELIEKFHLHPITILSTLSLSQKQQLLESHVVLCQDICKNKSLIDTLSLTHDEKKKILDEVEFLCRDQPKH